MKSPITKLAAAAAVIVIATMIGINHFGGRIEGASVAWADVVREMQQTKTVTWTEMCEVSPPDQEHVIQVSSGHVSQCAYKAPGHQRREVTDNLINPETKQVYECKHTEIIDRSAGKHLSLDPEQMTAALYTFEPKTSDARFFDFFLNPNANMPPTAQSLGTKHIAGREAVGFQIRKKGNDAYLWAGDVTDVWVDVKTKRVVLLQTSGANGRWVYTLKDFVFDQELDDSLFSLEPPEGYRHIPPPEVLSVEPPE